MKPPTAKKEELKWPRLSVDLIGERHPFICQGCNFTPQRELMPEKAVTEPEQMGLNRWQECDDNDKGQPLVVILCKSCSDELIAKHERLYIHLRTFQPFPGTMPICETCSFRQGLHCSHPDLKENGGEGLKLVVPKPATGFVDFSGPARGESGPMIFWTGPVLCPGNSVTDAPGLARCQSCKASIVWMKTVNGKSIPVDAASVRKGDLIYNRDVGHISHFATCPDAKKFSKKGKK